MCAEYCMQWLHAQSCVGHTNRLHKIFELENMVIDLFGRVEEHLELSSAIEVLTGSAFDYESDVR